eukprot:355017-Chlamydomonas_euryale.AAC.5
MLQSPRSRRRFRSEDRTQSIRRRQTGHLAQRRCRLSPRCSPAGGSLQAGDPPAPGSGRSERQPQPYSA